MPIVFTNRTNFSVGAIIALLVLVACFVFWLGVGHVTPLMIVALIAALAIALLLG